MSARNSWFTEEEDARLVALLRTTKASTRTEALKIIDASGTMPGRNLPSLINRSQKLISGDGPVSCSPGKAAPKISRLSYSLSRPVWFDDRDKIAAKMMAGR